MAKWEENEYVIEAKQDIISSKESLAESQEIFDKYSEQVKAIDPVLFGWMESGFNMDQFYSQMSIDNNMDFIYDSKRAYENRVAGAKKAAETRKLNKLKTA
jgi:hypothetical protein